jgi:drug/metabolite transporter (DMT)-like permease
MSGSTVAILCAFTFAFSSILTRRAVIKVPDAALGVLFSVPTAVVLFFIVLVFTGDVKSLFQFSWQGYLSLSAAGVLQFAIYRSFMYNCVKLVGANITSILRRFRTIVAVVLGISVLGEPLDWQLALGVLFIVFGVTIAGLDFRSFRNGQSLFGNIPKKAFLMGIGGGISGGLSPILIKIGLSGSGSTMAGVLISHAAATVALSLSLLNQRKRANFVEMPGRAIGLFLFVGLFAALANLFRFTALHLAPASVVSPLSSISPVFLLILSFLFNRQLEIFSRPVIIGTITVFIGSILLV